MPATTGLSGIPLNEILINWDGSDVDRFLYHYIRHAKTHSWTDDQKAAAILSFCSPEVEDRIRMYDSEGTKAWGTIKQFLMEIYGNQTDYRPLRKQYEDTALEPGERMSSFIDRCKFLKAKLNTRITAYNTKYATHLAASQRVRPVTSYELFTNIFDKLKAHKLFLLLASKITESSSLKELEEEVKSLEARFGNALPDTIPTIPTAPTVPVTPAVPPQASLPPRSDAHMLRLESMIRDLAAKVDSQQPPTGGHANAPPPFLNRAQADGDDDDDGGHSIHPDRRVRFDTGDRPARHNRDRYDDRRSRQGRTQHCVLCDRQGHIAYKCTKYCCRCGDRHITSQCRKNRDDLQCGHCGKDGHMEQACISKKLGRPPARRRKRRPRDSLSPSRSRSPDERRRRSKHKSKRRRDKKRRSRSRSSSPSPDRTSSAAKHDGKQHAQPQAMVHAQQQHMPPYHNPMMPMYGHPHAPYMYAPSPVPPYAPLNVYRDSTRTHTPSPMPPQQGGISAGTIAASLFNAAMSHAQPAPTAPTPEPTVQQTPAPEQPAQA